jgi:hypothetical protein
MDSSHNNVLFKPKIGSTFEFEVSERKETKQSRGTQKETSVSDFTNNAIFLYAWGGSMPNHNYKASIHFKSLKQTNFFGTDSSINRTFNSPSSPFQKGLNAFTDVAFILDVEQHGKVAAIGGYGEFKNKFDSLYSEGSSQENPDLWIMFRKEYFTELFENISAILPDTAVSIGSSWTKEESAVISDPMRAKTTYHVTDINENIVYIKTSYAVEQELKTPNSTMIMKGSGDGHVELDANSGMLIRKTNSILVVGNMNLGGINMTMSIKYQTEIKGKPYLR